MDNTIVVALIAAAASILIAYIQRENARKAAKKTLLAESRASSAEARANDAVEKIRKEKSEALNELARRLREPPRLGKGERRNSTILIGLGNSGKTELIRNLFEAPDAEPDQKTTEYRIYKTRKESAIVLNGDQDSLPKYTTNLYISDYRGQNLGSLISSFIFQQKIEESPMSYGYVNSLVLVVDPVSVVSTANPRPEFSQDRIDKHVTQWNDAVLDAVFGLLTRDTLKFVCLFINKSDIWRGMEEAPPDRAIVDAFEPVADLLREKSPGSADVKVLIGSAVNGESVTTIRDNLIRHSVEGT